MNPINEFTLGIDLSQDFFDAAISRATPDVDRWRDLRHTHVPFAPADAEGIAALLAWIAAEEPNGRCVAVVAEATGKLSMRFAAALRGHGLPEAAVINPRRSKAFGVSLGVRDKDDEIDSKILALYGATHRPRPLEPRTRCEEKVREITRLREEYVRDLSAWKNRRRESLDADSRKSIDETIKHLEKTIEALDEAAQKAIAKDKGLSRQVEAIKKIKGIKRVVATTLTAEMGDLTRYSRTTLVAAAGLFPKRFKSGTSVERKPRLAKGGGGRVRRVLYMAAMSLFHSKGPLREHIERLRRSGLSDMSIAGALMRKLLLIARAVAKSGNYAEERICSQGG
jgi:transposase